MPTIYSTDLLKLFLADLLIGITNLGNLFTISQEESFSENMKLKSHVLLDLLGTPTAKFFKRNEGSKRKDEK